MKNTYSTYQTHLNNKQQLQQQVEYTILDHLTFSFLIKKLIQNFKKVWTSLVYLFHKVTFNSFEQSKYVWLKVAAMLFIVFMLWKKDVYFQLRMKAPSAQDGVASAQVTSYSTEKMGVTPNLGLLEAPASKKYKETLDAKIVEAYINRFAKVAISEHQKFGIPASIKMAQAIVESKAGTLNVTHQLNNHFGQQLADKAYENAWENWRAHSLLLAGDNSPYKSLLQHGNDYKKWAKGLQQLKYSYWENYDEVLIKVIEQYEIYRLDKVNL
jgi:flagellum-specific peptidoglycan hydrolase FlgJ